MNERKGSSFKRKSKTWKKVAIWRQGNPRVLNRICACILALVLVFTLWPVTALDAIARTNTEIDTDSSTGDNTDQGANLDLNTDTGINPDVIDATGTDTEAKFLAANTKATGISNPQTGDIVTWDCVWFGSYPQSEVTSAEGDIYNTLQKATGWNANGDIMVAGSKYRRMLKNDATYATSDAEGYYNWSDSTTWHYFKYEPIKWRVLNVSGGQAFLLSDVALDDQRYNTTYTAVTWETSTVRSWLNGYGSSANAEETDYSGKNFMDSAFSPSEKGAIANTNVVNANNIEYGTVGGENTTDKLFLLSESEVYHTDAAASYGFAKDYDAHDPARRSKCSAYSFAMGTYKSYGDDDASGNDNCWWWLRSPGDCTAFAVYVYWQGWAINSGHGVHHDDYGIRPALKLNLSSTNLYSCAGTVSSDGTVNEESSIGDDQTNPGNDLGAAGNDPSNSGANTNPGVSSNAEPAIGTVFNEGFNYFTVTGNQTVTFDTTTNKKAKSTFVPSVIRYGDRDYNVTAIKANAFKNCKKLKKLTIKSKTLQSVGKNALKGTAKNLVIKVPASKRNAYKKLFKNKGNRTITVK